MPINETLGPYKSQDLLSSYDIASALNQLTIAITALAGGGGGGGGGSLSPSGSDGDIQIRAAAALAAISRTGGVSTDYLARDNSYRSLPIVPVPAGADGDVQLKSGTSLAAISRFGGALTDYLAKDNSYKTIPAVVPPAGTDGDLQVKSGTVFSPLSRSGGATSDYLARDNAYHSLPSGFLPAGTDGDIQIKAGANLNGLTRTGGTGTDYLARDNTYKTIPTGTANQLIIASRTVAIGTTFVSVGSGGPSTIRTMAYASAADGGGATYTRVSSAPTYSSLIWFQSADGQYWSMLRTNEPFKLEQAGGGTGASGAANNAAVEAINSMFLGAYKYGLGYGFAGANFQLGYGTYNFATPWFIKGACKIEGMSSGFIGGYATELKFPANCDGLVCGAPATNGRLCAGGIYDDFDGRGTVIRDLKITGGWDQVETTMYSAKRDGTGSRGFGILAKGGLTLENLYINRFAEVGVYTKGTAGGGGSSSEPAFGTADNTEPDVSYVCAQGYANNFTYIAVEVDVCGCDGFRDIGADANAGNYYNCSATSNGAWGFNSKCFLGNWFFGCHSASNGGPWYFNGLFDPTTGKSAGAYQCADVSNFSVLTACYSESGQAGRHCRGFTTILGGLHGAQSPVNSPAGWDLYSIGTAGLMGPITIRKSFASTGGSDQLVINGSDQNDEMLRFQSAWNSFYVRAQFARLRFGPFDKADSLNFNLGNPGASQQGRGAGIPYGMWTIPEGLFVGAPGVDPDNDCRLLCVRSAVPTTGTWARGDVIHARDPSAGGSPGWVCTSSGTPGTWKAMANLAS
jgi:hypothetical protein